MRRRPFPTNEVTTREMIDSRFRRLTVWRRKRNNNEVENLLLSEGPGRQTVSGNGAAFWRMYSNEFDDDCTLNNYSREADCGRTIAISAGVRINGFGTFRDTPNSWCDAYGMREISMETPQTARRFIQGNTTGSRFSAT